MKQRRPVRNAAASLCEEAKSREPNPPVEWRDGLVRLLGWRGALLHGDPTVLDRWRWLRRHLQSGPVRTLDAGCGAGAYTFYAASIGNEAIGLSFDEQSIRRIRRRARILGLDHVELIDTDLRDAA